MKILDRGQLLLLRGPLMFQPRPKQPVDRFIHDEAIFLDMNCITKIFPPFSHAFCLICLMFLLLPFLHHLLLLFLCYAMQWM